MPSNKMQTDAYIFADNLRANQRKALFSLLSGASYAAAGKAAKVSKPTVWRWLQESNFQKAYREGRRLLVEKALSELQQATGEAVSALKRNLTAEAERSD